MWLSSDSPPVVLPDDVLELDSDPTLSGVESLTVAHEGVLLVADLVGIVSILAIAQSVGKLLNLDFGD